MYSRYGKEDKLVNLFGIMQAIVSFFQDDNDNLRSIVAGGHRFVFMCRGPLVFVSVSQSGQSDTQVGVTHTHTHTHTLKYLIHNTVFPRNKYMYISHTVNKLLRTCTHTHTQLAIQLNYVYYQILSVLTNTQLSQRFESKPGFDLRYLLQGSEKFIDNILNLTDSDPSFTLNGVGGHTHSHMHKCLHMLLSTHPHTHAHTHTHTHTHTHR